jgi:uncharacterized membrane protein YphA (DoxX/SURF4 family)
MNDSRKWMRIAGLVLHVLIGAMLIGSGAFKLLKPPPPEFIETLKKIGLDEQLKLIGAGELITGIMLILPWTASLGVLLASGFWGGTIVAHMGMHSSYILNAVLLAVTWVGASLRLPEMFSSFWRPRHPTDAKRESSTSSLG